MLKIDIEELFLNQFLGMTQAETALDELVEIQRSLPRHLVTALDDDEKAFLISIKRGKPEWARLGMEHLSQLPAIQWKLINIGKMDPSKHKEALDRLIKSLSG